MSEPRLPNEVLDIIFNYASNIPIDPNWSIDPELNARTNNEITTSFIPVARTNIASRKLAVQALKPLTQETEQIFREAAVHCLAMEEVEEGAGGTAEFFQIRARIKELKKAARMVMMR